MLLHNLLTSLLIQAINSTKKGKYNQAITIFEQARIQAEKEFGKNHENHALSCNDLASIYSSMGDYPAAEPLYVEAKNIHETNLQYHWLYQFGNWSCFWNEIAFSIFIIRRSMFDS